LPPSTGLLVLPGLVVLGPGEVPHPARAIPNTPMDAATVNPLFQLLIAIYVSPLNLL
jgi:hypothetical protein